MARGINKVILIGNLGADPESRAMPSGMTVANIRVATSETWKDKQSGESKERTEWHTVAMFGKLGDIAGEYLKKGSKVYIEGSLRTRKWQDKQGNDRYTTEIQVNEFRMLGKKSDNENSGPRDSDAGNQRNTGQQSRNNPAGGGFDEDIPF